MRFQRVIHRAICWAGRCMNACCPKGLSQGCTVLPRCGAKGPAEAVVEVAGAGKAAGQSDLSQWQVAVLQQLLSMAQTLRQHITMGRYAKTELEHSGEVIFGEGAQAGQLGPKAQWLTEIGLDKFSYPPALAGRWKATFQAQPFAPADLGQQGMADQAMGQAAAEHAFAGFIPIQLAELAKALGLLRIIEKGAFAQFQFPWLTIQQMDGGEGELLLADIQVRQLDFTVDHPGRLVARPVERTACSVRPCCAGFRGGRCQCRRPGSKTACGGWALHSRGHRGGCSTAAASPSPNSALRCRRVCGELHALENL